MTLLKITRKTDVIHLKQKRYRVITNTFVCIKQDVSEILTLLCCVHKIAR